MAQQTREWERRVLVNKNDQFVGVKYVPVCDNDWKEWNNILLLLKGPVMERKETVSG